MPVVFPIAYFGSIKYFRELAKQPEAKLEAWEHFPKQTMRNRTTIPTANGLLQLSVPVTRPNGSKSHTKDVLVNYDKKWQLEHWRAIKSAYESSPYFDYYGVEVKELIFSDTKGLFEFDSLITRRILNWLDLNVRLSATSEFIPIQKNDYRECLSDKRISNELTKAPYIQVFPESSGYDESISILDAIFCEGPLARNLLVNS